MTLKSRCTIAIVVPAVALAPETARDAAIIGDPRNDDNVIVSQLHASLARIHNLWMQRGVDRGEPWMEAFERVCREMRRHYQWIVLNDFLPRLTGPKVVGETLPAGADPAAERFRGRIFPLSLTPAIPVEFSVAALRVGHAMVRDAYVLNERFAQMGPMELFSPDETAPDLRGGRYLPAGWEVDWRWFLPIDPAVRPQSSQTIGPRIAPALSRLPGLDPSNLALRTLRRGQAYGLPAGQAVAETMGETPVRPSRRDPLWLYVLYEAEELHGGRCMGPVGGRIVAEVIIGLLAADPQSYVNAEPGWTPSEGVRDLGSLLALAAGGAPSLGPIPITGHSDLGPSWHDLNIPNRNEFGPIEIAVDRDGSRKIRRYDRNTVVSSPGVRL
ncbi:MAG: hypothetical protein O3A53_20665 [Acidobacteria bacterium]|nr:hypothetical protein [Acidobacteriota bacterium]